MKTYYIPYTYDVFVDQARISTHTDYSYETFDIISIENISNFRKQLQDNITIRLSNVSERKITVLVTPLNFIEVKK